MKLSRYAALCFDMDFTMVNYNLDNFMPFIYQITADYLINVKGYSSHLKSFEADEMHFMRRGLVLDKRTHCVIDVTSTGTVRTAYRGTKRLTNGEIFYHYPEGVWPEFSRFYEVFDCDNTKPLHEVPYFIFDSVFVSPTIPLLMKQLDIIFTNSHQVEAKCREFYVDLIASFVYNFNPDNNAGSFFPTIERHVDLYIQKSSTELRNKLLSIREAGTKLVLITASDTPYTELLMSHSYGKDWRSFFDLICCRAKKPGFFTSSAYRRPFFRDGIEITELLEGGTYLEGHWTRVDKWIRHNTSKPGRVAYVGDSFKSDIIPTKLATSWDIIAVVLEGKLLHVSACEHKKPRSEKIGWESFFGDRNEPSMYGGRLFELSDLTLTDVEELVLLGYEQELPSNKTGNSFTFSPF